MNFERVMIGLLIAVIVLQLIESSAGEDFASLYVVILVLGAILVNHVQLQIFADQLVKRLQGQK